MAVLKFWNKFEINLTFTNRNRKVDQIVPPYLYFSVHVLVSFVGERNEPRGSGEGPSLLWLCHHFLSPEVRLQNRHQGNRSGLSPCKKTFSLYDLLVLWLLYCSVELTSFKEKRNTSIMWCTFCLHTEWKWPLINNFNLYMHVFW